VVEVSRVVELDPPVCEFCGEFVRGESQPCAARDEGGVSAVSRPEERCSLPDQEKGIIGSGREVLSPTHHQKGDRRRDADAGDSLKENKEYGRPDSRPDPLPPAVRAFADADDEPVLGPVDSGEKGVT
jgi:hypothetical protein